MGLGNSTIRNYMSFMRAVVVYATRCGYAQYKVDPFILIKLPQPNIRQSWLTVEEIKAIRDAECDHPQTAKIRDLFMLSYYLGGINMADLVKINFNKCRRRIKYIRQKIENRSSKDDIVEFDVPKEAKEIIVRITGPDGRIAASDMERENRFREMLRCHLNKLSRQLGINKIIFYSARKSFSQHAFNLGISTTIIDYLIGHKVKKTGSCLYHYICVTPEMASQALRKVLDNLK